MTAKAQTISPPPSRIFLLHLNDLRKYFFSERASFIFICIYSFFEYVRPQAIYASLKGLPFTSVTVLLALGSLMLEGIKPRKSTGLDSLIGVFTIVVLAATATAVDRSLSLEFIRPFYLEWVLIIMLIAWIVNTEKRFFVFMLLWLMWSFKMSQHGVRGWAERGFSFASWGMTCAPQFFQNSGECGIQMAIFFPISLYFYLGIRAYLDKKRKIFMAFIPASAAITIMASSSRGAQLALAAILLWLVLRSKQRVKALVYAAVAAAALYAMLPPEELARFQSMGSDPTSVSRKQYWKDGIHIMSQYPLFGLGPHNWLPYYRANYNPNGEEQHNIFVEAGTDLGYSGLIVFVGMIIATFTLNYKTRKMAASISDDKNFLWCMAHGLDGALVGYLVSGFFVTVLFYPFFWTNAAMTIALNNVTRQKLRKLRQPRMRGGGMPMVANNGAPPGAPSFAPQTMAPPLRSASGPGGPAPDGVLLVPPPGDDEAGVT